LKTVKQFQASKNIRKYFILTAGRKQDVWFAINPANGVKEQVISTENALDKCPGGSGDQMFIGRSGSTSSICVLQCLF